jgi:hypothetical protein
VAKVRNKSDLFIIRWKIMQISLHKDFHAVEHEDLALACLANLIGVKQFELASAYIVVVLDADASSPLLDFTF